MESRAFVEELERSNQEHLARIDSLRDPQCAIPDRMEVARRLKIALRQELEAAEIAALMLTGTPQIDVKLALGKLCGDECKHYRLILERLERLGEDISQLNIVSDGRTGLYDFLASLTDAVERVAAALFSREAVGHIRNQQFIDFCLSCEDLETARMYQRIIQPDEWSHVEVGRKLLEKYAQTEEQQQRARAAAARTLEIAEGAVEMLLVQQKVSNAPGC